MYIQDANGNYLTSPTLQGQAGREVQLRVTSDYIQWRYVDLEWQNLIPLSTLMGARGPAGSDGKEVAVRVVDNQLQWRLGTDAWQLLIDLSLYATIQVGTTTTSSPTASASVSNSGSSSAAILNFTIPRGKNLEFVWNGTQLGIRQEGDSTYQYVNLKGDGGTGDMQKATYDTNSNGIVDNSEKLGGQLPSYYAKAQLTFLNTVVATGAWASDTTYSAQGYGYRATIPLTGVTSALKPIVTFGITEAMGSSGSYSPIAESYNGGVYIYSRFIPTVSLTIPVIDCWAVS